MEGAPGNGAPRVSRSSRAPAQCAQRAARRGQQVGHVRHGARRGGRRGAATVLAHRVERARAVHLLAHFLQLGLHLLLQRNLLTGVRFDLLAPLALVLGVRAQHAYGASSGAANDAVRRVCSEQLLQRGLACAARGAQLSVLRA